MKSLPTVAHWPTFICFLLYSVFCVFMVWFTVDVQWVRWWLTCGIVSFWVIAYVGAYFKDDEKGEEDDGED